MDTRYALSRSGKVPKETLKKHDYSGTVLTDGFGGYNRLKALDIVIAYCWAHARRQFTNIESNYPVLCNEVLDLMDKLFEIERKAHSFDELLILRKKDSRPLLEKIYQWLVQKKTHARDQTGIQQAINYSLRRWEGLTRFGKILI